MKDNNYWYIDDFGRIHFSSEVLDEIEGRPNNWMARKLFGNYFETKEEAMKAVEKLKAFKRLKDKEFEFVGCFKDNTINFEFVGHPLSYDEAEEAEQDLAFIFGGEQ